MTTEFMSGRGRSLCSLYCTPLPLTLHLSHVSPSPLLSVLITQAYLMYILTAQHTSTLGALHLLFLLSRLHPLNILKATSLMSFRCLNITFLVKTCFITSLNIAACHSTRLSYPYYLLSISPLHLPNWYHEQSFLIYFVHCLSPLTSWHKLHNSRDFSVLCLLLYP